MPIVHFLNVKEGDCSIIQHYSGRVTVIDVCNAKPDHSDLSISEMNLAKMATRAVFGNFNQKAYPVNPVAYLREHGIDSIFRYIQTHPDMDHMDGIRTLYREFSFTNFWDTNNSKELDTRSWSGPYNIEDWQFYKHSRDRRSNADPKRLALLSGARGKYYNENESGSGSGDGLYILAPTQELVEEANRKDEYNDCSYVLLYRAEGNRIIFSGDSHDETWNHILERHKDRVQDIDLLVAPHHGRDSGRSYEFLDVLNPALTFFGNAPSDDLAYRPWWDRGLPIITNNQANCMIVDASQLPMPCYVTNETFAKARNPNTYFDQTRKGWFVGYIVR